MKFLFLVIFFSLIFFGVFLKNAYAFGEFGGKVGAVFPCLNGIKFVLIPPASASQMGGTYLFRWGTLLYKWWQPPRPGLNILGKSTPGGCCWIPTPKGPHCLVVSRSVLFMGTSR